MSADVPVHKAMNPGPPCLSALGLMLVLSCGSRAADFVEISADLELAASRGSATDAPTAVAPRTVAVQCITSSREWRIDHDYIQNGATAWYFDGTNVYNGIRITRPMPKDQSERMARASALVSAPFDVAESNLTIQVWASSDGHPGGDAAVNVAWLAFCSGPYLKRAARLIPLPLDDFHHTRDRFAYTDRTVVFEDHFGLPRSVELFLSKSLFLASEAAFDKECFFGDRYTAWTKKTAESLPDGAHMFHYTVTEATNFLGRQFPLKFEFSQMGRPFEQNGDWFWRGSGRIKSIRPGAKPDSLFDASMQQTIVDWRFHDDTSKVDAIVYPTTNTFLLPKNDPELQKAFARKAKWGQAQEKERKSRQ